jgi:hypothetical protein
MNITEAQTAVRGILPQATDQEIQTALSTVEKIYKACVL